MKMQSGWTKKSLLLLFAPAPASGGYPGGGLMPDPAEAPRRWMWQSVGQMAVQGHGHWTVRRLEEEELLLLLFAALLR